MSDVVYDDILHKMRMGDEDSGGGQYVKQMVYITDSETTNATIALTGGTHLEFTQPLQGLTFASVQSSHDESEIVFTAGTAFPTGENPDPKLPVNASVLGELNIEAGKKYLLNIRDAAFVCGEFTVVGMDLTRGVWYYDATGVLDPTTYYGQTTLSGATISGGTLVVNGDATITGEVLLTGATAYATIAGTVASVGCAEETDEGIITVSGGSVGTITTNTIDYLTISGGTVASVDNSGVSGEADITVSGGYVGIINVAAMENVIVSGTALISGLTATNANDLGASGPSVTISGGTVDRLVMGQVDDEPGTDNPQILTITAGTVGLALVTQTGISNGTISATISESATVINLED